MIPSQFLIAIVQQDVDDKDTKKAATDGATDLLRHRGIVGEVERELHYRH